jgi:creatinine amidohydrolase
MIVGKLYLADMTYVEVSDLDKERTVIFLPMGPLEAHGPHLPLGVDFYAAQTVTEMTVKALWEKGVYGVIAPTLPYTLADVAMPFAGTVTLSPGTIKSFIHDFAYSISRHGFKKIVLYCHHLERSNLSALQEGADKASKEFDVSILVSSAIMIALSKTSHLLKGEHPQLDSHAGESETAYCLWKHPELVKQAILPSLKPVWVNIREKFSQGAADFVQAGGIHGYFGDPAKATAEMGKKLYATHAEVFCDEIANWYETFNNN